MLQSWPLTRLASEGVALFNLAAAPAGGVSRDVLLKFFVPDRALPFHSFSQVGKGAGGCSRESVATVCTADSRG